MVRGLFVPIFTLMAFLANTVGLCPIVYAQEFRLPAPGVMVHLSPPLNLPILKGIKVHPDNPFLFDFILDKGDSELSNDQLKHESTKLIKYFLASLTIPEKDLWVNLSPYEKDRIIPQIFGLTEMGRDLLAEDYMLKQITASLIYPEDEVGKRFWKRVYEEAAKRYGTTNVPINTFNKVWIVPEKVVVYENAKAGTAYVVKSRLKVMLEQDYLSLEKHLGIQSKVSQEKGANQLGSQIVREMVIPELNKEVNEGKNFVQLRQVYNSLILATWYKKKIRDTILSQVYSDKSKVAGVKTDDPQLKEKIYQRYLRAFKKGVYNYIKEEHDPMTQEVIPRKYFSGGITNLTTNIEMKQVNDSAMFSLLKPIINRLMAVKAQIQGLSSDKEKRSVPSIETPHQNTMINDDYEKITHQLQRVIVRRQSILLSELDNFSSVSFENALQIFNRGDNHQVGTLYRLENPPTIAQLKELIKFNGEIEVARIRGTEQWVIFLSQVAQHTLTPSENWHSRNFFNEMKKLDSLEIDIHNHPLGGNPFPSFQDVAFSYFVGGRLFLVTNNDFIEFNGTALRDLNGHYFGPGNLPDFHSIVLNNMDLENRGVDEEIRKKAHLAYYEKLNFEVKPHPWTEVSESIFNTESPNDIISDLNSQAPERRLRGLGRISEIPKISEDLLLLIFNYFANNDTDLEVRRLSNEKVQGYMRNVGQEVAQPKSMSDTDTENHINFIERRLKELVIERRYKLTKAIRILNKEAESISVPAAFFGFTRKRNWIPLAKSMVGVDGKLTDEIKSQIAQKIKEDYAQITRNLDKSNLGGIDLTSANMNLQTQNQGGEIKFYLDPAMLQQLQSTPGFVPVIINIQPMTDLKIFLGSTSS